MAKEGLQNPPLVAPLSTHPDALIDPVAQPSREVFEVETPL